MVKLGSLRSYNEAKNQLSRLIKAYHLGKLDSSTFRSLVYGFSALLQYFKLEKDLEIEERLDKIEKALEIE